MIIGKIFKVFSGFFPEYPEAFVVLRRSIEKLSINDSSVTITEDSSPALGQGYRLGFLGLLHMEVFKERLEKEFDQSVIITSPNVPYKVKFSHPKLVKFHGTNEITVVNPTLVNFKGKTKNSNSQYLEKIEFYCLFKWPENKNYDEALEPVVLGTIVCPTENLKDVNQLCLVTKTFYTIVKLNLDIKEMYCPFLPKESQGRF